MNYTKMMKEYLLARSVKIGMKKLMFRSKNINKWSKNFNYMKDDALFTVSVLIDIFGVIYISGSTIGKNGCTYLKFSGQSYYYPYTLSPLKIINNSWVERRENDQT